MPMPAGRLPPCSRRHRRRQRPPHTRTAAPPTRPRRPCRGTRGPAPPPRPPRRSPRASTRHRRARLSRVRVRKAAWAGGGAAGRHACSTDMCMGVCGGGGGQCGERGAFVKRAQSAVAASSSSSSSSSSSPPTEELVAAEQPDGLREQVENHHRDGPAARARVAEGAAPQREVHDVHERGVGHEAEEREDVAAAPRVRAVERPQPQREVVAGRGHGGHLGVHGEEALRVAAPLQPAVPLRFRGYSSQRRRHLIRL